MNIQIEIKLPEGAEETDLRGSAAALHNLRIQQAIVERLEHKLIHARSDVAHAREVLKWAVEAENEIKAAIETELRLLDNQ